jgi:hypothetical protein
MCKQQKIAIVLWIIQAIALFGGLVNGDLSDNNLFYWIGFFIPGLIGIGLWFSKKN